MEPKDQWWVINGGELMRALKRAAEGEDPDLMYLELEANSNKMKDEL
jgi:hypothetical protein